MMKFNDSDTASKEIASSSKTDNKQMSCKEKQILPHVIANEYVLSMVNNTVNLGLEDESCHIKESMLTRSKAKEKSKKQCMPLWPDSVPVRNFKKKYNLLSNTELPQFENSVSVRQSSAIEENGDEIDTILSSEDSETEILSPGSIQDQDSDTWQNFVLQSLQPEGLTEDNELSDDLESDPNFKATEEETPDFELQFEEKPRNELNDLVRETFELVLQEVNEDNNDIQTLKYSNEEHPKELSKIPTSVSTLLSSEMTPDEKLQLEEQLRMHVQLLSQSYLLSSGNAAFNHITVSTKLLLDQLKMFAVHNTTNESASVFNVQNLDGALGIVEEFDNMEFPNPSTNVPQPKKKLPIVPPHIKKTLAASKVFIYPELLPACGFRDNFEASKFFCTAEDNLISLGLERFSKQKNPIKFIHKFILPAKSVEQIRARIKNSKSKKIPDTNPIKFYHNHNKAPLFPRLVRIFNPDNVKAPKDYTIDYLPKWMEPFCKSNSRTPLLAPSQTLNATNQPGDHKKSQKSHESKKCNNILPRGIHFSPMKQISPILKKYSQQRRILPIVSFSGISPHKKSPFKTLKPKPSATDTNLKSNVVSPSSKQPSLGGVQQALLLSSCATQQSSLSSETVQHSSNVEDQVLKISSSTNNRTVHLSSAFDSETLSHSPRPDNQDLQLSSSSNNETPTLSSTINKPISKTICLATTKDTYVALCREKQQDKISNQESNKENSTKRPISEDKDHKSSDVQRSPKVIALETEVSDEIDEVNEEEHEPNTTVLPSVPPTGRKHSISKKRNRHLRELEASLALLQPNVVKEDPMKDEREVMFANSYLLRATEILKGNPDVYEQFLYTLSKYHSLGSPVELYSELKDILKNYPTLVRDFIVFLNPAQAKKCGKYKEYIVVNKIREFFRKIELHFKNQPLHISRILKTFSQLHQQADITSSDVISALQPLLKNQSHLMEELNGLLPDASPPEYLMTDFEDVKMPNSDDEDSSVDDPFEEIIIPDTPDPYGGKNCPCDCHKSTTDNRLLNRIRHCVKCGVKFIDGRIYIQTGKVLKPAQVIYHNPPPKPSNSEKLCSNVKVNESSEAASKSSADLDAHLKTNDQKTKAQHGTDTTAKSVHSKGELPAIPSKCGPQVEKSCKTDVVHQIEEDMKASQPIETEARGQSIPSTSKLPCDEDAVFPTGSTTSINKTAPSDFSQLRNIIRSNSKKDSVSTDVSDPPTVVHQNAKWTRNEDKLIIYNCQRYGIAEKAILATTTAMKTRTAQEVLNRFLYLMVFLSKTMKKS